MKHLDVNWGKLVERLDAWSALSGEGQAAYLQLKQGKFVPRSTFSERDQEVLFHNSFIAPSSNDRQVKVSDAAREFSKAMRAMARHPFVVGNPSLQLFEYVREHLTQEERRALLGTQYDHGYYAGPEVVAAVMQQAWVDAFLALEDAEAALAWERSHLPMEHTSITHDGSPYFADEAVLAAAQALVRAALTWAEPVPLRELADRVPGVEPAALWRALLPAFRYLLLFPRLTDGADEPVVSLWPGIVELRHRPPSKPPAAVEPTATVHAPWLADDLVAVIVAASAEPLRLLASGGKLYAKDQARLAAAIVSPPEWLVPEDALQPTIVEAVLEPSLRATVAVNIAEGRQWVRHDYRQRRISATEAGLAWVAASPVERLRELNAPWREQPPKPGKARRPRQRLAVVDRDGAISVHRDLELSAWVPGVLRYRVAERDAAAVDWRAAIRDTFADADGRFVPLADLLGHHARVSNPLTDGSGGRYGPLPRVRRGGYGSYGSGSTLDPLALEDLWWECLADCLAEVLLPMGAVEIGRLPSGDDYAIRLHPIGRYALGLTDDLVYEAAAEGEVVVQPNFEVIFLGPAPQAEAIFGRYAERVGRGVGTLFRITRASVFEAAGAGFDAETALNEMQQAASKPIPENVVREVRGWVGATRRGRQRRADLIEAPDAETAVRILAAAGNGARPLTPTIIDVTACKTAKTALARKLRQSGVFID